MPSSHRRRNADLPPPAESAIAALRAQWTENPWVNALCDRASQAFLGQAHGDLPRWLEALRSLPRVRCSVDADQAAPRLGGDAPDPTALRQSLMAFHPWRKGPLALGGVKIDSEWRSDRKWERVRPHLGLRGQRILDIGCGNGYFGWRMLGEGARLVVGIDPMWVFVMQWLACRHFAGEAPHYVLPLAAAELPAGPAGFDTVFSMGVLYHQRNPLHHLRQILRLLRPGGTLVLETLVLPDRTLGPVLVPRTRYARMRNVWAIPHTDELERWVNEAGYVSRKLVDVTITTTEEQRTTQWMAFESLAQALDPDDPGRTLEGYPAPTRAVLIARS